MRALRDVCENQNVIRTTDDFVLVSFSRKLYQHDVYGYFLLAMKERLKHETYELSNFLIIKTFKKEKKIEKSVIKE